MYFENIWMKLQNWEVKEICGTSTFCLAIKNFLTSLIVIQNKVRSVQGRNLKFFEKFVSRSVFYKYINLFAGKVSEVFGPDCHRFLFEEFVFSLFFFTCLTVNS